MQKARIFVLASLLGGVAACSSSSTVDLFDGLDGSAGSDSSSGGPGGDGARSDGGAASPSDGGDGATDRGDATASDGAPGTSDAGSDGGKTKDAGADAPPPPYCGDGVKNGAEQCDGKDLGGATCASVLSGYQGTLACNATCSFDVSGCAPAPRCGDGVKNGTEQCDGADLGGATCASVVPGSTGTLRCGAACAFDSASCKLPPSTCDPPTPPYCAATEVCDPVTQKCTPTECAPSSPCPDPNAVCVVENTSGGACYPTCTFDGARACSAGLVCQPSSSSPDAATTGVCLHPGTGGAGAACSLTLTTDGCASGVCIFDVNGAGSFTCHATCSYFGGGSCSNPATGCVPGNPGMGLGYCSTQGEAVDLGATCATRGDYCGKSNGRFEGVCASSAGSLVCAQICALGTACAGGKTCSKPYSNALFGACQ